MEKIFTATQYGSQYFNDFFGLAAFFELTDYAVFDAIIKPAFTRGFVDYGPYRVYAATSVLFSENRAANFTMNLRVVLREQT